MGSEKEFKDRDFFIFLFFYMLGLLKAASLRFTEILFSPL